MTTATQLRRENDALHAENAQLRRVAWEWWRIAQMVLTLREWERRNEDEGELRKAA